MPLCSEKGLMSPIIVFQRYMRVADWLPQGAEAAALLPSRNFLCHANGWIWHISYSNVISEPDV